MYKKICWRWISLSFVLHYVEKWMYIPQFYFLRPNTCILKHYELLCSNNVNLWKEVLHLILRKFHEITIFPVTDMNILTNYNLYNNKANTAFHLKQRMCIDFIYFDVAFSKRVKRMRSATCKHKQMIFPTVSNCCHQLNKL